MLHSREFFPLYCIPEFSSDATHPLPFGVPGFYERARALPQPDADAADGTRAVNKWARFGKRQEEEMEAGKLVGS